MWVSIYWLLTAGKISKESLINQYKVLLKKIGKVKNY